MISFGHPEFLWTKLIPRNPSKKLLPSSKAPSLFVWMTPQVQSHEATGVCTLHKCAGQQAGFSLTYDWMIWMRLDATELLECVDSWLIALPSGVLSYHLQEPTHHSTFPGSRKPSMSEWVFVGFRKATTTTRPLVRSKTASTGKSSGTSGPRCSHRSLKRLHGSAHPCFFQFDYCGLPVGTATHSCCISACSR